MFLRLDKKKRESSLDGDSCMTCLPLQTLCTTTQFSSQLSAPGLRVPMLALRTFDSTGCDNDAVTASRGTMM